LDGISLAALVDPKEETDGEIPRERLLAAIGRKQGDTLDRLAERHGVVEKTIRNWLDRFDQLPLADAPYDDHRPGRPPKVSIEQLSQVFDEFQQPPTDLGSDRQAWTTALAAHHIQTAYDVEYTRRHVRDLLTGAGLSWQTARQRHVDADGTLEDAFQTTVQKRGEVTADDRAVVVVDQFTKRIGSLNRHGWSVAGSNPTINTTPTWDKGRND
jgi:transposase